MNKRAKTKMFLWIFIVLLFSFVFVKAPEIEKIKPSITSNNLTITSEKEEYSCLRGHCVIEVVLESEDNNTLTLNPIFTNPNIVVKKIEKARDQQLPKTVTNLTLSTSDKITKKENLLSKLITIEAKSQSRYFIFFDIPKIISREKFDIEALHLLGKTLLDPYYSYLDFLEWSDDFEDNNFNETLWENSSRNWDSAPVSNLWYLKEQNGYLDINASHQGGENNMITVGVSSNYDYTSSGDLSDYKVTIDSSFIISKPVPVSISNGFFIALSENYVDYDYRGGDSIVCNNDYDLYGNDSTNTRVLFYRWNNEVVTNKTDFIFDIYINNTLTPDGERQNATLYVNGVYETSRNITSLNETHLLIEACSQVQSSNPVTSNILVYDFDSVLYGNNQPSAISSETIPTAVNYSNSFAINTIINDLDSYDIDYVNFTVTYPNGSIMLDNINGSVSWINSTDSNWTSDYLIADDSGTYTWSFNYSDGSTDKTLNSSFFINDSTEPDLEISSLTITTASAPFTLTVLTNITDNIRLDSCWYELTGANSLANTTFDCINFNESLNTLGSNTVFIYANDSLNNINAKKQVFTTEVVVPIIPPSSGGGSITEEKEEKIKCDAGKIQWTISPRSFNTFFGKDSYRERTIEIINNGTEELAFNLNCDDTSVTSFTKNSCQFVNISSNILLVKPNIQQTEKITVRITTPEEAKFYDSFSFGVFFTDNQACSGTVSFVNKVTIVSGSFYKIGQTRDVGGVPVPIALPFLLTFGLFIFIGIIGRKIFFFLPLMMFVGLALGFLILVFI